MSILGRFLNLNSLFKDGRLGDLKDQSYVESAVLPAYERALASVIHLSPRTVEHRLERIKKQTGAKNLHHLTALVVTVGFDRSIRYTSDGEA